MQISVGGKLYDVVYPRLTLRTEPEIRRWYNRLQDVARAHTLSSDHLARVYALALKRGVDLSAFMTPDGALRDETAQQELVRCLAEDVDLLKALLYIERYPRTRDAILVAIEWLRDMCRITDPTDDDWQDVPYEEIARAVEDFFASFRG